MYILVTVLEGVERASGPDRRYSSLTLTVQLWVHLLLLCGLQQPSNSNQLRLVKLTVFRSYGVS